MDSSFKVYNLKLATAFACLSSKAYRSFKDSTDSFNEVALDTNSIVTFLVSRDLVIASTI